MFDAVKYLNELEQPSPFASDDENAYRAWAIWSAKKAIIIIKGKGDKYYNLEKFIYKMDLYSTKNIKYGRMFSIARDIAMDIYDKIGGH